jgi:hypothetical protein
MSLITVFIERSTSGTNNSVEKLVFEWRGDGKLIQLEGEPNQDPITFCSDGDYSFGYKIVLPPGVKIIGVTQGHWAPTDPKQMSTVLGEFQPLKEHKKVLLSLEYPAKASESRYFKSINIYRL